MLIPCLFFTFSGAKVSDTIRKGIITLDAYPNGTETEFMLGNTAALGGEFRFVLTVVEVYDAQFHVYIFVYEPVNHVLLSVASSVMHFSLLVINIFI